MNSTVKTILAWVLILVAAVGLYDFFERSEQRAQHLTFTEFLTKVDQNEVRSVEIAGLELKGSLISGDRFGAVIPGDYPDLYSVLLERSVEVRIQPQNLSSESIFMPGVPSWVLLTIWLFWIGISCATLLVLVDLSKWIKR